MVKIELQYEGDLRCGALHEPSQTRITTDAPIDNEGRGASFSPTDLVATAVGTCMMTIMGIYARRHELKLEGTRVTIGKHMTADPVRRIGKIDVDFHVSETLDARHREALERAAHSCPVAKSLAEGVEIAARFHWAQA